MKYLTKSIYNTGLGDYHSSDASVKAGYISLSFPWLTAVSNKTRSEDTS